MSFYPRALVKLMFHTANPATVLHGNGTEFREPPLYCFMHCKSDLWRIHVNGNRGKFVGFSVLKSLVVS